VRIIRSLPRNLDPSDTPILDAYEAVLSPRKQQRFHQLSYVYVLCPHCDTWRIHGRAPHETKNTIYRASHCVDCPTEATGYGLRIIGPWTDSVRRRCLGRYKPTVRAPQASGCRRPRRTHLTWEATGSGSCPPQPHPLPILPTSRTPSLG
jgi:hypothetical protein